MIMLFGMAAAVAGSVMEYRMLLNRRGQLRELIVSVSILVSGIVLVLLQLFHYKLPSIMKLIENMLEPVYRLTH